MMGRTKRFTVEMATVTSAPMLLYKVRYMFFFTVKLCLFALL